MIVTLIGKNGEWVKYPSADHVETAFVPKGYCWVHSDVELNTNSDDTFDSRQHGPVMID